ncbi:MAG: hypothetical protein IPK28_10735 [Devosia sp.]|nr:hypothetical protein [Devosia sp.]
MPATQAATAAAASSITVAAGVSLAGGAVTCTPTAPRPDDRGHRQQCRLAWCDCRWHGRHRDRRQRCGKRCAEHPAEVDAAIALLLSNGAGVAILPSGLDQITATSSNSATVQVGAVALSGATVEIASDTDVDIDVTVGGLTLAGLAFGTENIAITSSVTNLTTVTVAANADIDQTGAGTVSGSDASVVIAARDLTEVAATVSADAQPLLPLLDGLSLIFDTIDLVTVIDRTTEVELGDADAVGAVTPVRRP